MGRITTMRESTGATHAECGGTWLKEWDATREDEVWLVCSACWKTQDYRTFGGIPVISATVMKPDGFVLAAQRPGWHEYFLGIADAVSKRADCTRRKVGAVLVKENRIMATGYNGGPSGGPSCLAGECPRGTKTFDEVPGYVAEEPSSYDLGPGSCIALHAEQNAIMYSSMDDRRGATLYVTCEPCAGCWRMLQGSGIQSVVYHDEDGSLDGMSYRTRSSRGEFR